jgi:NNP family nitrate/nitrite transporter-like MFS transporter
MRSDGDHTSSRLSRWDPDDGQFWEETGRRVAMRNLIVSIPNLLCGFAVWLYWGMVAKFIQRLHFADETLFDFTFMNGGEPYGGDGYRALLFMLPAVAGLTGATLRVPNSFMIAICGGRNVKFMTTTLLLLPAVGAGIALQDPDTPFIVFILLAALAGVGGGAFASSMSNISFFFPKRMQGLSLGLNAGIGNLGVSVMQFLLPWIITFGAFGSFGGDGYLIPGRGGGEVTVWVQNAGLVWIPILAFFGVAAFFFMDNLPQHKCGSTPVAVAKYLWLTALGFLGAAAGIVLLIVPWGGFPELLKIFVLIAVAVIITLAAMRYLTPRETKENLVHQFSIFNDKHNWIMTWLYTMTFGSFIGYANAFPKLIDDVFGVIRVDALGNPLTESIINPNAPLSSSYIWIGAGVGALIRPVGGWLSDKIGGARVTHWDTIVMIGATIGVVYPSVRYDRHRQRIDLSHGADDLLEGDGWSRPGLDLGDRRLWRLPDPEDLRHADPSGDSRVRALRLPSTGGSTRGKAPRPRADCVWQPPREGYTRRKPEQERGGSGADPREVE